MRKTIILLLIIMLLGGISRFWNLKFTPPGLYPDEAMNGIDAVQTLESGQWKVFYPENNGREGLFIWLIALNFNLFGISIWSLRFTSAIIGFLTILGLFLLAKELFNEKIALLSSFFLAVSFWHSNFSRIGFRAILVPFLMCFSFYFLLKGIRDKKTVNFIAGGALFGLGFYTYIAFRASILLLGILLLMEMWKYWKKNKSSKWSLKKNYVKHGWWKWDAFFITALIIALPLILHFYRNPNDFMGRTNDVSVFNSQQPLKELSVSAVKTLGMFNFIGDANWRHNYSGTPMLAWTVGILFLIGLALIITNTIIQARGMFFKSAKNPQRGFFAQGSARSFCFAKNLARSLHIVLKNIPRALDNTFSYIFILLWLFIMLLPAVFTIEGMPHALRTIGAIPAIYILAAIGFAWLFEKISKNTDKKIAAASIAILLIHPVYVNFSQYFCRWANDPDVSGAFEQNLVDIGNYLSNLPEDAEKYVIANSSGVLVPYPDGLPMPVQTIKFVEQSKNTKNVFYIKPENINQIQIQKTTILILLRPDENLASQISQRWPNNKIRKENDIWSFLINK